MVAPSTRYITPGTAHARPSSLPGPVRVAVLLDHPRNPSRNLSSHVATGPTRFLSRGSICRIDDVM